VTPVRATAARSTNFVLRLARAGLVSAFFTLSLLTFSSCNSPVSSGPAHVAPANDDWLAAFSKLSPAQKTAINHALVYLEADMGVDSSILHMTGTGVTQELITTERLDIAAICYGFNRNFGHVSGKRWSIVRARSYEQIGAPGGVQKHRFRLDWNFRNSTGEVTSLSAMDIGPGVNVIWGPSQTAIDAEMNQAFAKTFLGLVAQLESAR